MKGRNKKIIIFKLCLGLLVGIVIIITVLILRGLGNESSKLVFEDNEIFCLGDNDGGKGKSITIGEYLVYAASIIQTSTKDYGTDVWTKIIQDEEGKDISFEDYMKQEIINQIRLTHILNLKAEEYKQALSEDELRGISTDAQTYYDTLSFYDIGKAGIDLSLILNIYRENALAEKVFNAITKDVTIEDGMTEDEYRVAMIHYFDRAYQEMKKEYCEEWSFDAYVNINLLSELSFASIYNKDVNSSD